MTAACSAPFPSPQLGYLPCAKCYHLSVSTMCLDPNHSQHLGVWRGVQASATDENSSREARRVTVPCIQWGVGAAANESTVLNGIGHIRKTEHCLSYDAGLTFINTTPSLPLLSSPSLGTHFKLARYI